MDRPQGYLLPPSDTKMNNINKNRGGTIYTEFSTTHQISIQHTQMCVFNVPAKYKYFNTFWASIDRISINNCPKQRDT